MKHYIKPTYQSPIQPDYTKRALRRELDRSHFRAGSKFDRFEVGEAERLNRIARQLNLSCA